ncbi:hypothetical protein ACSNOH_26365 [Streptomyces sp. URMC 127]|uniref:hypothetical protein n=1 Tax=Streptomyces sp. URMC 127 TaxID=3423402 RepID=UPI003F1A6D6B
MSEQYEYFVKVVAPDTEEHPSSLWRRQGEEWGYFSLLDWEWHKVFETTVRTLPDMETLRPVTPERAAELEGDRQSFVRYWALYADEEDWREGESPTTLVRRRRSPERLLDESFQEGDVWGPTNAVFESRDLRTSNPPYLQELTSDEAEALAQELFGLTGVTEL